MRSPADAAHEGFLASVEHVARRLRALPRSARVQVREDIQRDSWLVNTNGAALVLRVRPDYLRKRRSGFGPPGPPCMRVGEKIVWYPLADLLRFNDGHVHEIEVD